MRELTADVDGGSRLVIDAASARDLGVFLAVVAPTPESPVVRPVVVSRGDRKSVVQLLASVDAGGAWRLTIGDELPDVPPPDEPEQVDPRLEPLTTMAWITDAERLARWFNGAWLAFVGGDLVDELGWGWMRHVYPDDLVGLLEAYEEAHEARHGFDHTVRGADAHGRYHHVRIRALP